MLGRGPRHDLGMFQDAWVDDETAKVILFMIQLLARSGILTSHRVLICITKDAIPSQHIVT
jgi:hypothetical protein